MSLEKIETTIQPTGDEQAKKPHKVNRQIAARKEREDKLLRMLGRAHQNKISIPISPISPISPTPSIEDIYCRDEKTNQKLTGEALRKRAVEGIHQARVKLSNKLDWTILLVSPTERGQRKEERVSYYCLISEKDRFPEKPTSTSSPAQQSPKV